MMKKPDKNLVLLLSMIFLVIAFWVFFISSPKFDYPLPLTNEEEVDNEQMRQLEEAQQWCVENPLRCKG